MKRSVRESSHRRAGAKISYFVSHFDEDDGEADLSIVAPIMARLPPGAESVLAALPIHNANAWLARLAFAETKLAKHQALAVFAADPFLDTASTLAKIRRAGASQIAIWPSVGVFGAAPDFSAVGLGFEREVELARTAIESGLDVAATVFNSSQAMRMVSLGARHLLLHPPIDSVVVRSRRDLVRWLQSIFPDGRPDGVNVFLHSSLLSKRRASLDGLVDGYLRQPPRARQANAAPSPSHEPATEFGGPRKGLRGKLPFLRRRRATGIVGAAVGTGSVAHAAAKGGADFVVALSAGRFRMMGAPSTAAYLPLRDANSFVDGFAREEILPHATIPVFLGVFASDLHRSIEDIVTQAAESGYDGITNFPTVARYTGGFRTYLEAAGFGIEREVKLIELARRAGLATLAYARDAEGAISFAERGADMLCLQFGPSAARSAIPLPEQIEDIAGWAGAIIRRVHSANSDMACLLSGGLILNPKIMVKICGLARADGFIGGSTIDQIPLETSIEDRTAEFKAASMLRHEVESIEKQIRLYRRFGLVTTESDNEIVHQRVKRLAAGDNPIVISGSSGTGKSLLATFVHSIGPLGRLGLECLSLDAAAGGVSEADLVGMGAGIAGNQRARLGWFQVLSGRGLVLDRLDRIGPAMQSLLLDVLEERRFRPLGGAVSMPFDLRLILTSREPLTVLRNSGVINEDLYLKLRPTEIELRSLRDRPEDIPTIVEFLLSEIGQGQKDGVLGIEHAALRALQTHDWPGNIRALRSFLEEAALLANGRKIMQEDIEAVRRNRGPRMSYPKGATERDWIADALRRHRFRRADTADFLGISRKTLYTKIKHFNLLGEK